MNPAAVRKRILDDHVDLRTRLDRLEQLARSDRCPPAGAETLRAAGCDLLARLEAHMAFEDVHLARVLREADAWGEERERRLVDEHRQQRAHLKHIELDLREPAADVETLAHELLDLIAWLRRDMAAEERERLDPDVLRDDVVGIRVEAG
ncbi:MAG: hemerythrin domain-containing protein [Proteobacteria bacterium]|nr:hemerythrin domain-containing protein [Pseudomonadota bacterium]